MTEKKQVKKRVPKTYRVIRLDIDEGDLLDNVLLKLDKEGYDLVWIQEQTHTHDEVVIFKRRIS